MFLTPCLKIGETGEIGFEREETGEHGQREDDRGRPDERIAQHHFVAIDEVGRQGDRGEVDRFGSACKGRIGDIRFGSGKAGVGIDIDGQVIDFGASYITQVV